MCLIINFRDERNRIIRQKINIKILYLRKGGYGLKDKYNREIDYIRISITDRCNLRCVYCMPNEGVDFVPHENILTYEEIIRLCQSFAKLGIRKVKLTGGEPLVRKDLAYLIQSIKEIEGIEKVTVTTNGILLAEQMDSLAKAGVDGINISLDTLNAEHFAKLTRFDGLDRVKAGINEALKYKNVTLKINCVPLRQDNSDDNILSMVSLAKDNLLHVRFIEIMPIGFGKELESYSEEQIKQIINSEYGSLVTYNEVLGNGPCHYFGIEGFQGKIGFISAISHQFCSSCDRIRLTSEGYLKTCLQYASGTDLKVLLRQGITDEELQDVIQTTVMQKPKEHHFKEYINKKENGIETLSNQISDSQGDSQTDDLENNRMSQIGG